MGVSAAGYQDATSWSLTLPLLPTVGEDSALNMHALMHKNLEYRVVSGLQSHTVILLFCTHKHSGKESWVTSLMR